MNDNICQTCDRSFEEFPECPSCCILNPIEKEMESGNLEKAMILIEEKNHGLDRSGNLFSIESKDPHGYTLFLFSALYGNIDFCEILRKKGADINAISYQGMNALFFAAYSFNCEMIRYLIYIGVNPNQIAKNGKKYTFYLTPNKREIVKEIENEYNIMINIKG